MARIMRMVHRHWRRRCRILSLACWRVICGALNTRDPREFLAPLASLAQNVTCLAIPGQDASLSANELCSAAQDIGLEAQSAASLQAALAKAHNGPQPSACNTHYHLRITLSCRACSKLQTKRRQSENGGVAYSSAHRVSPMIRQLTD